MLRRFRENYRMDNFLYWYSQNNKTVIQILAVLIGFLLIYLIYRLFFATVEVTNERETPPVLLKSETKTADSKEASSEAAEKSKPSSSQSSAAASVPEPITLVAASPAVEEVKKENPKPAPASTEASVAQTEESQSIGVARATDTPSVSINDNAIFNEVSNLKKDLAEAQATIKAKENEIADFKEKLLEQQKLNEKVVKGGTRTLIDTANLSGDKDLIAKIDELQKKLTEYDIISDDISELQSLRKENAELKEKANASPA